MIGSRISCGSCDRTAEIASRMSCVAWSTGLLKTNCTMIWANPSVDVELILSMPLMPEILSSSRVTTSRSTTSGEAPGYAIATNTIGASMSGNSSVSRRAQEAKPKTTSAIIVTTVMIGRLIAKSDMNMAALLVTAQFVSLQELRLNNPSSSYHTREINMKYGRLGMIALAALTFGAMPAHAQFPSLSLMGGVSFPKGDASQAEDMGYNGAMGLNFSAPLIPIGVRLEAGLSHFPGKTVNVGDRKST